MSGKSAPAVKAVPVVLDTPYNQARALWVGVAGDITAVIGGAAVLHKNVPVGVWPIETTQVNTAGTTATDMVAWY